MTPPRTPEEESEKRFHAALRALPDRPAPRTLEARVLTAVAARAARPWWRQSWSAWPAGWRIGFFLLAVAVVAGGVAFGAPVARALAQLIWEHGLAGPLHTLGHLRVAAAALRDAGASLLAAIPLSWVYGITVGVGGLYALVFGLGAAAYRALWESR